MNLKEIKAEFGDCDWIRAFLNGYTVDAILWLMNRVEKLEAEQKTMRHLINPPPPMLIAKNIQIAKDGKFDGGSGDA